MEDSVRVNSDLNDLHMEDTNSENDEYTPDEKKLLNKVLKKKHQESGSEDEVYSFSESDGALSDTREDIGISDSDVEGQEKSDDDLPDVRAWGKNKKSYYATDYVDKDYGGFGDEQEAALMEEEEARSIQKRLLEQLEEDDYALDFISKTNLDVQDVCAIQSDLSEMSKKQKMQLLEKESPEFTSLISDFKTKLTVAKDDLQPVLKLVKDGKIPKCSASKFINTNYNLILNYCTNISFYVLLKSKKINIHNHPVIKRLFQYKQLLNKMEPIYLEIIKPQINKLLNASNNDLSIFDIKKKESKKRKLPSQELETVTKRSKSYKSDKNDDADTGVSDSDFEEGFQTVDKCLDNKTNTASEESGYSDNDESSHQTKERQPAITDNEGITSKRKITYQIAKNKGLTPHRKKEQRNPRVKHKIKYQKAKIRRKGAVREPRTEVNKYSGEASGIKTHVKKSVKIK